MSRLQTNSVLHRCKQQLGRAGGQIGEKLIHDPFYGPRGDRWTEKPDTVHGTWNKAPAANIPLRLSFLYRDGAGIIPGLQTRTGAL